MFPWHFMDIFPVCILRNWRRWWFRTRVINISAAKWQTGRYLYFSSDCPDIHYKAVFSLVCMPSGLWLVIRKYSRQTDRPHSDHKVPLPPLRSLNINTLCGQLTIILEIGDIILLRGIITRELHQTQKWQTRQFSWKDDYIFSLTLTPVLLLWLWRRHHPHYTTHNTCYWRCLAKYTELSHTRYDIFSSIWLSIMRLYWHTCVGVYVSIMRLCRSLHVGTICS